MQLFVEKKAPEQSVSQPGQELMVKHTLMHSETGQASFTSAKLFLFMP